MVLDLDGEALLAGDEARTLGDRPALEDAVELEAEIVVEAGGVVLLHDEGGAGGGGGACPRLRGLREVALGAIAASFAMARADPVGSMPVHRTSCDEQRPIRTGVAPATSREARAWTAASALSRREEGGRDELAGVVLARRLEDLLGRAALDHLPSFITMIPSAMARTTARSWLMKR